MDNLQCNQFGVMLLKINHTCLLRSFFSLFQADADGELGLYHSMKEQMHYFLQKHIGAIYNQTKRITTNCSITKLNSIFIHYLVTFLKP